MIQAGNLHSLHLLGKKKAEEGLGPLWLLFIVDLTIFKITSETHLCVCVCLRICPERFE